MLVNERWNFLNLLRRAPHKTKFEIIFTKLRVSQMKKFIVIYHAPQDAIEQTANATPEQMEEGMKPWMEWAQKCGSKLVDLGTPLAGGQRVLPGGKSEASTRSVCGYSILEADSMEEAKSLLAGHPHLMWRQDCEIEVHEAMPLPM
jgi:hypothetical protein